MNGLQSSNLDTLHKKMKFLIKDFFSKCDQIRRKLLFWSHLLEKFLIENFIFLCSDGSYTLWRGVLKSYLV